MAKKKQIDVDIWDTLVYPQYIQKSNGWRIKLVSDSGNVIYEWYFSTKEEADKYFEDNYGRKSIQLQDS